MTEEEVTEQAVRAALRDMERVLKGICPCSCGCDCLAERFTFRWPLRDNTGESYRVLRCGCCRVKHPVGDDEDGLLL